MSKFTLQEIAEIKGRIKFFKLIVDGICLFDEFEKTIEKEGNMRSELRTIQSRMHLLAGMQMMPASKFKDITPSNDKIKEYEIKTHHLRVYMFHETHTGRIVVLGGKKGSQDKDIKYFRSLKAQYFNSK